MEFKRTEPDCSFTVPDKITIRQQMAFFSEMPGTLNRLYFERLWESSKTLIENWNCPIFPDMDASLDDFNDPQITNVLIWAGAKVREHINSLTAIPKN